MNRLPVDPPPSRPRAEGPPARVSARRPRWPVVLGALAATLACVLALRGCLLDARTGVAALAAGLERQSPEARVLVGADGFLRVLHADGLAQLLDLDPLQRTCASLPGSCEVEIRRLLGVFAASRAEGFARDSVAGPRLRPFVLGDGDDEALAATEPLAVAVGADAPAAGDPAGRALVPGAASTSSVASLRFGLALRTGEVMTLVTPALLDRWGTSLARLLPEAVANLDADPAPVRLDPLLMTKGVSWLNAPGDPAAQLLSPARMRRLLGAIGDRRVAFALPRRGWLLLARDREPDRAALVAAAGITAPAAMPPAAGAAADAATNPPATPRPAAAAVRPARLHRYALDGADRPRLDP
ncbi:hypothetical protein [Derxia gummosa]|uniref:Uncharacterized protein n=1 Tax=Derxia gummosa DSM 723 TaxID=1121388 RepID=A0A8B6X0V8_9BURK|nr:hypothetical protein [Derxia gummosa]